MARGCADVISITKIVYLCMPGTRGLHPRQLSFEPPAMACFVLRPNSQLKQISDIHIQILTMH